MSPSRRLFTLLDAIAESVAELSDEEVLSEATGAEDAERVRQVLLENLEQELAQFGKSPRPADAKRQ